MLGSVAANDRADVEQHGPKRSDPVAQAESELRGLRKHGLTPAGEQWLRLMLDIFADDAAACVGYPDKCSINTISQMVTRRMRLTKPPNLPSATWDCVLFSTPSLQGEKSIQEAVISQGNTFHFQATAPNNPSWGTVVAIVGETGVPLYPAGQTGFNPLNKTMFQLSPSTVDTATGEADSSFTNGSHRLVSCGWEGVATGPPVLMGGEVVPFANESNYKEGLAVEYVAGGGARQVTNMVSARGPPALVEDVLLLPNTRTWNVRDGFYQNLVQDGPENPFVEPRSLWPFMVGSDNQALGLGQTPSGHTSFSLVPTARSGHGVVELDRQPTGRSTHKFGQKGVFLTNLTESTVITVTAKFIMERRPTISEPDLVTLARPSPAYDPVAYMLYSAAVRDLPPACPVGDNFMGAWFAKAANGVLKAVAPQVPRLIGAAKKGAKDMPGTVSKAANAVNRINRDIDDISRRGADLGDALGGTKARVKKAGAKARKR